METFSWQQRCVPSSCGIECGRLSATEDLTLCKPFKRPAARRVKAAVVVVAVVAVVVVVMAVVVMEVAVMVAVRVAVMVAVVVAVVVVVADADAAVRAAVETAAAETAEPIHIHENGRVFRSMRQWWCDCVTIGDSMKVNSDSSWAGLHRSVEGISRQASGMQNAAENIVGVTVGVLNGPTSSMPVDRVSVGENAVGLDDSFIDSDHYKSILKSSKKVKKRLNNLNCFKKGRKK